jgi:hypothetical protein
VDKPTYQDIKDTISFCRNKPCGSYCSECPTSGSPRKCLFNDVSEQRYRKDLPLDYPFISTALRYDHIDEDIIIKYILESFYDDPMHIAIIEIEGMEGKNEAE